MRLSAAGYKSKGAALPHYRIRVGDTWYDVEVGDLSRSPVLVLVDGEEYLVEVDREGDESSVASSGPVQTAPPPPAIPVNRPPAPNLYPPPPPVPSAPGAIHAPMAGVIVQALVAPGDRVTRGQDICILEAMKMQQFIKAVQDGVVRQVLVAAGQRVTAGDVLVEIEGAG